MLILLIAIVGLAGMIVLLRPWPFFRTSEKPGEPREWQLGAEFGKWVEKHAAAHGLEARGVARLVALECPSCHRNSNYFVYPDEICEGCWRAGIKRQTEAGKQRPLPGGQQELPHPR